MGDGEKLSEREEKRWQLGQCHDKVHTNLHTLNVIKAIEDAEHIHAVYSCQSNEFSHNCPNRERNDI